MSIELDQEILEDFLVEGGELVDDLSGQLMKLESNPENKDVLNSVFRAFHTIKGGAGFLQIDVMVECCHLTENLFDELRNGRMTLTQEIMDAVLSAYDEIEQMFELLRNGDVPNEKPIEVLDRLNAIMKGEKSSNTGGEPARPMTVEDVLNSSDENISEEEFDLLIASMGQVPQSSSQKENEGTVEEEVSLDVSVRDEVEVDDSLEIDVDESSEGAPLFEVFGSLETVDNAPKKVTKAPEKAKSDKRNADSNVRVDTALLDSIMNMVGELVLTRNRLVMLGQECVDEDLKKAVTGLDMITSELQMEVMRTRMQPVKKVFGRFPRVVRDLCRSLGKEVDLVLEGEETALDKNLVDALADPLIHLVRNAVDHGIELPDVRAENGKPRTGRVVLSASQEGDHILLVIEDDGAGMDADKLRGIAIDKGLLEPDAAARLSDQEAFELIFHPGFSTKKEISDVSGRGVGMDVVKTNITGLNGMLSIDSVKGVGSKIIITVPLTLAIMPSLMVKINGQIFALPLSSVEEIISADLDNISLVDGQEIIVIRERAIPLYHVVRWLSKGRQKEALPKSGNILLLKHGINYSCFVVDELLGQEEVVIKPLGSLVHDAPGMSGATITGSGEIAMIIDIPSLIKHYG